MTNTDVIMTHLLIVLTIAIDTAETIRDTLENLLCLLEEGGKREELSFVCDEEKQKGEEKEAEKSKEDLKKRREGEYKREREGEREGEMRDE